MKIIKKFFICLLILFFFYGFSFTYATDSKDLSIDAQSALLMDLSTGKILYEKNINEKMYPASTTKVMTAILVLEKCNLNDTVVISKNAVSSVSFGYVTANLKVDEELTVEQLLHVLMVGSSNDAAIALAEHVSGSVENFTILMNEKAKEIGCQSTNFVNPNGIHDNNHYSTAYDLALISKYAMQNPTFQEIVFTSFYKLTDTNKYNRSDRWFSTTNDLINKNSEYYYKYATGIKTGFTTPAGNCLIASASKDNLNLLSVVLNSSKSSQRFLDCITLFDYGFNTYVYKKIVQSGDIVQTVVVNNATKDTKNLDAAVSEDVWILLKKEEDILSVSPQLTINSNLKAPIHKGDVIGTIKYSANGISYESLLLANSNVERSFLVIYIFIFVIILFIGYFSIINIRKKKKRKRK